jgi:hypothetical protein
MMYGNWDMHALICRRMFCCAGLQVDLRELFEGLPAGRHVYRLRSMVCYYGAHYQAFVLVPDLGRWLMFDDTRVSNVGGWADVRRKCELGRIQPSLLFYERAVA